MPIVKIEYVMLTSDRSRVSYCTTEQTHMAAEYASRRGFRNVEYLIQIGCVPLLVTMMCTSVGGKASRSLKLCIGQSGFHWADFLETRFFSGLLGGSFYRISHGFVNKHGEYDSKSIAVTEQIFTEVLLAELFLVKNPDTDFHENPTDGLVIDTRSHIDQHGLHIRCFAFHFITNTVMLLVIILWSLPCLKIVLQFFWQFCLGLLHLQSMLKSPFHIRRLGWPRSCVTSS